MAWYNKYRPNKFENVIGQELVKTVLQNSLAQNKVKHAYLFAGPKGTGKTTLARIFANELLKDSTEPDIDIIELDAASNTGIDNVRQLIESAGTPPMSGKYKVYIIDEVHMLSKQAMNALLKTLEEPPQYLVFLLATTNPEKLIPTVMSRLTKLNLTSHTIEDLVSNLQKISSLESLEIEKPALEFIAKRAGGGQRDAINLLETVSGYSLENYSLEIVSNILGFLPTDLLLEIAEYFCLGNGEIKVLLQKVSKTGLDGETFLQQLLEFLLDLSLVGDERFDDLIWVCSQILSLKLPITSVVSIFALIQSRIRKPQTNLSSQNSEEESVSVSPKKNVAEKFITPTETKTFSRREFEPSFDAEIKFESVAKEIPVQVGSDTISQLLNNSDLPFALKTFGNTIFILEETSEKIIIGVINNLAKGQLDKASVLEYIKLKLNKTAVFELNANKPIQTFVEKKTKEITKEIELPPMAPIEEAFTKPQVQNKTAIEKPNAPQKKYESEVPMPVDIAIGDTMFYSIYKRQNLNLTRAIPIHLANISIPSGSEETDEWLEFVTTKFDLN